MASAKSIEVLGLLYSNINLLLYSFTCIVVDVKKFVRTEFVNTHCECSPWWTTVASAKSIEVLR